MNKIDDFLYKNYKYNPTIFAHLRDDKSNIDYLILEYDFNTEYKFHPTLAILWNDLEIIYIDIPGEELENYNVIEKSPFVGLSKSVVLKLIEYMLGGVTNV